MRLEIEIVAGISLLVMLFATFLSGLSHHPETGTQNSWSEVFWDWIFGLIVGLVVFGVGMILLIIVNETIEAFR